MQIRKNGKTITSDVQLSGENSIGIEVPDKKREWVDFAFLTNALDDANDLKIPVLLGRDVSGEPVVIDLSKCGHLLVAGNPETGKTNFLDSLICSIRRTKTAEDVVLALIDTKGVEFPVYNGDSHLMLPVITKVNDAFSFLEGIVSEIEHRVSLFNDAKVRSIEGYNRLVPKSQGASCKKLPYIVTAVDEFSHLMLEDGKRFETLIKRITASAKYCGIHLVISTDRCSAGVITGTIKTCFLSQIAFAVSGGINSRIIMDQIGAEDLLGAGDMLCSFVGMNNPIRIQGALVDAH